MINSEGQYYCIKDLQNIDIMQQGNFYNIKMNKTPWHNYIEIYNDNNNLMCECGINSFYNKEVLSKHFISLKEYRKLKLQKINSL